MIDLRADGQRVIAGNVARLGLGLRNLRQGLAGTDGEFAQLRPLRGDDDRARAGGEVEHHIGVPLQRDENLLDRLPFVAGRARRDGVGTPGDEIVGLETASSAVASTRSEPVRLSVTTISAPASGTPASSRTIPRMPEVICCA